jgi:hypothetical protein
MAGLDPAIHVFFSFGRQNVDARVKPGHDDTVNRTIQNKRKAGRNHTHGV